MTSRLIQIEGEVGLGKTRLLDELEGRLDDVRVGRAGCSELERHLAYVPLAAALRDALAGVELDVERLPALAQILPELGLGYAAAACSARSRCWKPWSRSWPSTGPSCS